jgi:MtfA peptidase
MFRSRRAKLQRAALNQEFPDAWRQRLAHRWPIWSTLDDVERAQLEDMIKVFVARIRWEAAQGFTVTDEMKLLIAAQACLLVLGHGLDVGLDQYRHVSSIIVHPRTVVQRGVRTVGSNLSTDDTFLLAGQAHHRGPVVLSWSTVAFEALHPRRGQNVVFHEFAHQLDMIDGMVDGTPPIDNTELRDRFIAVCTAEYRRVRRGDERVLRPYAGTDTGEFFAVATETFFTRPVELRQDAPELYQVLTEVYRQDPAGRMETLSPS